MPIARIESLDHEGRGVTRSNGKVIFIEDALPGESVRYSSFRKKPRFELAKTIEVLAPSAERVSPRCRYFGVCGGCSLQHLQAPAQVAVKQRVLEDAFRHIGDVAPEVILPAIGGAQWGYRQRARLAARLVPNKGGVLVGFHERRSSYVVDMESCEVAIPEFSQLIGPLRELVTRLSVAHRLPQIELTAGEQTRALVLRHLLPLDDHDKTLLRQFGKDHGVVIYLQPGGPETAYPFHPETIEPLYYDLPDFRIRIHFAPTDFVQVNSAMNRMLVRRAVALLDPQPSERVSDLFCGVGNFALPIARLGARVTGIEGDPQLVIRARENARLNGLEQRASFLCRDLFQPNSGFILEREALDKVLLDPPREGAIGFVKALQAPWPKRIVYVSCNPATLARDAQVLVHAKHYRLSAAGVINMFPHTAHVESIALFERE